MRLKKFFAHSPDLLVPLAIGAVAVVLSYTSTLEPLRIVIGLLFVFVASGYPITRILPRESGPVERLLVASVVSLLLTYPATVLTVLVEGHVASAIFGRHLTTSLTILFLLTCAMAILVNKRKPLPLRIRRFPALLLLPLTMYALLVFVNLNRADVFADEYDLGYQAYNLVDGIKAGRRAYTVSYSGHPPLAMDIKHFSMNIHEPDGLDLLEDWQFRVSEGLVGLFTLLAAYLLARELFSENVALITAALLAVNNYMVWMGRIFHREMYLTLFMTAGVYFYAKAKIRRQSAYWTLAGFALGASLLVKETALIMMVIPAYDILVSAKHRKSAARVTLVAMAIFLPVIMYNIAAYLFTGYADVFFSHLFGESRPMATPLYASPIRNLHSMFSYLLDLYSPLVFEVFAVGVMLQAVYQRLNRTLVIWLVAGFVFFTLTSVRAYYFLFLTIPLAIIASAALSNFSKLTRTLVLTATLGVSLVYSINTNIYRGYTVADRAGTIDESVVVKRTPFQHYSIAARSWSEEVGYKRLQSALDQTVRSGDCVIVSESLNPLAVRRYLGLNDEIKKYYLGQEYPSRYPSCPSDLSRVRGKVYMVSEDRNQPGSLIIIVSDHLGNDRFFLFELAKGNFA